MKELVRDARRLWVVAAAVTAVIGGVFGITIAVAKSLSLESRVTTLERHDREAFGHAWRMDAKIDIIMTRFGIEVPARLQAPATMPPLREVP